MVMVNKNKRIQKNMVKDKHVEDYCPHYFTYHKHCKKKCNEKNKWPVTMGTSCSYKEELFCCTEADGSDKNKK